MGPIFAVLVVGCLALVAAVLWSESARRAQIAAAKAAYSQTLAALTLDPTNASCKQAALARGRDYAHALRSARGVTVVDELMIANDLGAACAGAMAAHAPHRSLESRLSELAEARTSGLITAEECQVARARIVADA